MASQRRWKACPEFHFGPATRKHTVFERLDSTNRLSLMAQNKIYSTQLPLAKTNTIVYPIAIFWGAVAIVVLSVISYEISLEDSSYKYYLLPWCFLTGAVLSAPAVILFIRDKFDPFHPLVFPAWSYFIPAFFIGGILMATGVVEPYYLAFVENEHYNLPLTFVYIILGYLGLVAGFGLPVGKRIGERIAGWLPKWNWPEEKVPGPGLILLALGLANTAIAFGQGILGFQKVEERGIFDGIFYLLSLFWIEASVFLWIYVFRSKRIRGPHIFVIATLLGTSLFRAAFQGNRGIFITTFIMIAFAFVLSGRKITRAKIALGGVLAVAAVVFGMIYGTTFRSIKQDQSTMDMGRYAEVVGATIEKVGDQDIGSNLLYGFAALGERLESVSSLAVIVSNYEALAPYEKIYGINDNIWNDTVVFFIPRIVWPDKPVGIEPSAYADLYFNFSENAFTMTPIGDLVRNFGPFGVPVGMLILGILIRTLYSSLQEGQEFSYWRSTLYYMILTAISYEGTYGLILPSMVKVGAISLVGILVLRFFAGRGTPSVMRA